MIETPVTILDPEGVKGTPFVEVVRQSSISGVGTCSRQLMFDRIHGWQPGVFKTFGTAYHAGLEAYHRGGEAAPAVDYAFSDAGQKDAGDEPLPESAWSDSDWGSLQGAIDVCQGMVRVYLSDYEWEVRYPELVGRTIGVEVDIHADLPRPGFVLKGTVDRAIDVQGTELGEELQLDHLLVDYKTARRAWPKGKEHPRKNVQGSWYVHWWRYLWSMQNGGEILRTGFAFDIMTHKGKHEVRYVKPTDAQVAAVLSKAASYVSLIENDGPWLPNTDSFLCSAKWCDHWNRCEYGAAIS